MTATRVLALLFACSAVLPALTAAQETPSSVDLVEVGDMRFVRDRLSDAVASDGVESPRATDGFRVGGTATWPAGVVPVTFHDTVSQERRGLFFQACAAWAPAGVRCVEHTTESRDLLVLARDQACSAIVGAPRQPRSNVDLGDPACWERPRLVHMIGHVFGLVHEHQRADRDRYVEVHSANIRPEHVHEFSTLLNGRSFGEYDFDSVMHYAPSVYSIGGRPTMEPRPAYADRGRRMGLAPGPSSLDIATLAQFYGPSPRSSADPLPDIRFTVRDFQAAAEELYRIYLIELQRATGIAIGGRPDFIAIAAWIFDVYLNTRASGYTEGESLYNMRAAISHADEWRTHNPNLPLMPILPTFSRLRLDRGEVLQAMYRLDDAYRTELLRRDGLSLDGSADLLGIGAWIFDVYLNERLGGRSPDDAWEKVLERIRASDEYRQKHPA